MKALAGSRPTPQRSERSALIPAACIVLSSIADLYEIAH
jgi:hypothetical protein